MGVLVAALVTIVVVAGFFASLAPVVRFVDGSDEWERPALAVFGIGVYVLLALGISIVVIVFAWLHSGASFEDGGRVGDVRCQRYEEYWNGKVLVDEWQTIPCVQLVH